MARTIDPYDLDAEDIHYLQSRYWMVEEFKRQGLTDQMAVVDETPRRVPGEEAPPSTVLLSDMSRGQRFDGIVDKPPANGVLSSEEVVVDDKYEEWTKDELLADIDERNKEEDREVPLSKSGTKAELAARLHEDDEVSA